jgi:hypothetical protein
MDPFCSNWGSCRSRPQPQSQPDRPVARLLQVLDLICAAIAARGAGGELTKPLLFLLWRSVKQTAAKPLKLAADIAAGKPPPVTRPRANPRKPRPPTLRLPRGLAWMLKMVPGTAVFGPKLTYLFAQPELAPLVADARFRRMVNPLCQMLGIPKLPPLPNRQAVEPKPTDPEPAEPRPVPPEYAPPEQNSGKRPAGRDPPSIPVAA